MIDPVNIVSPLSNQALRSADRLAQSSLQEEDKCCHLMTGKGAMAVM